VSDGRERLTNELRSSLVRGLSALAKPAGSNPAGLSSLAVTRTCDRGLLKWSHGALKSARTKAVLSSERQVPRVPSVETKYVVKLPDSDKAKPRSGKDHEKLKRKKRSTKRQRRRNRG
jgi:hypothetical protein